MVLTSAIIPWHKSGTRAACIGVGVGMHQMFRVGTTWQCASASAVHARAETTRHDRSSGTTIVRIMYRTNW